LVSILASLATAVVLNVLLAGDKLFSPVVVQASYMFPALLQFIGGTVFGQG
jgi:hypothetical protein